MASDLAGNETILPAPTLGPEATKEDSAGNRAMHETPQDSQTLKNLEIALIRLSAANETIALLNERLKEKDAVIAAREGELAVRKELETELRSANKDRATVNNGDARMLEQANMVIAKQDAEIAKLRNPGWIASIFDKRTFGGAMVGYGACRLTSGSNPTINIPGFNSFVTSPEDRARQALRGK